MRSRYAAAKAVVVTGTLRFGITMARAKVRSACGRTLAISGPSRRCRCQSSGRVIVRVCIVAQLSSLIPGLGQAQGALVDQVLLGPGDFAGELHRASEGH